MSDTRLVVDPSRLTIGDLEDFEDVTGVSLDKAFRPVVQKDEDGNKVLDERGRPVSAVELSAKALKALIWILKRQDNPGFTLADARNVKVDELVIEGDDEDEDPTPAASA